MKINHHSILSNLNHIPMIEDNPKTKDLIVCNIYLSWIKIWLWASLLVVGTVGKKADESIVAFKVQRTSRFYQLKAVLTFSFSYQVSSHPSPSNKQTNKQTYDFSKKTNKQKNKKEKTNKLTKLHQTTLHVLPLLASNFLLLSHSTTSTFFIPMTLLFSSSSMPSSPPPSSR